MRCPFAVALALATLPLSSCNKAVMTDSTTHGIDVAGIDRSTKPGDDFFKFANGSWDKNTPIPPDRASWGIDATLDEQATDHTRALLEHASTAKASGSDERKAA